MRFEAVVELDHKRMIELRTDVLFVLNNVLLLVLADELFQHHLHRVELSVLQTAHQVNLAESSDSQALADLILLQPSFSHEFYAVKAHLLRLKRPFPDRNPVIEQQVSMRRFEPDHKCSFEDGIAVFILQEMAIDVLMEEVRQVFGLDADWQLDTQRRSLVVESD